MVLGLFVAQEIQANVLYLYGTVTSVGTNPLFKVGDAVYFKINYNASGGGVTRVYVMVNESELNVTRTSDGSTVTIDENASDGTVQWKMNNGSVITFDVASNTPGGVIPCIDSFDLGRTFQVFFNGIIANGTVTAKPVTRTGS